jgi:hypothetical protein
MLVPCCFHVLDVRIVGCRGHSVLFIRPMLMQHRLHRVQREIDAHRQPQPKRIGRMRRFGDLCGGQSERTQDRRGSNAACSRSAPKSQHAMRAFVEGLRAEVNGRGMRDRGAVRTATPRQARSTNT